jgi:peptidoglycan/LPS O-acetylase OafA/YrhL
MNTMPYTASSVRSRPALRSGARLDALDGFRFLAVISVVFYHFCYFWTPAGAGHNLIAFGSTWAKIPFVSVGFLGVNLFFVISGFVILLTLERTSDFRSFLARRAIRLWPALLLFGTLTFVIVNLYGPGELRVTWPEYLISLLILPPQHVALLLGAGDWKWLDGAYWSLWVEIKFYVVIGTIFYAFSRNVLLPWLAFELLTIAIGISHFYFGGSALGMLSGFFFQPYVPYFSFGLAAYMAWSGRKSRTVALLAALALLHVLVLSIWQLHQSQDSGFRYAIEFLMGQTGIFALFYLFAWRKVKLTWFEWSPLVQGGRASYGIYLLHQNIGVTVLSMPLFATAPLSVVGLLLTVCVIILVALVVFLYVERPAQAYLKRRYAEVETVPA